MSGPAPLTFRLRADGSTRVDLSELVGRARATRTAGVPLYQTAAPVWQEARDQLDSALVETLGRVGLDAVYVSGGVPDVAMAGVSPAGLRSGVAGSADWDHLGETDQEAFALLGFLTLVAEMLLAEDEQARRPLVN